MTNTDVVVVGAGLSGLIAARALTAAERSVVVLEARDRVGGRTLSTTLGGQTIDLGGQWMGDRHHRLRTLASELGITSFAQYARGKKILVRGSARKTYTGFLPKIGLLGLADLGIALARLERMARRVVAADPLATPDARVLDAQTFADWLDRHVRTRAAREMLGIATQMIFAVEPRDVSLLYFLLYVRAGEGLQRLAEVRHGAQERRFTEGVQAFSRRLADRLADRVRLEHPVIAIEQRDDGVVVRTPRGTFEARRAILAVPPALLGRIEMTLPAARTALHAKMPMGSVIKCIAAYDRPFWREAGYSGEALSTSGIVRATFDECSAGGDHAALVAFVAGDAAKQLAKRPEAERRAVILEELAAFHGPAARSPTGYADKDWISDEWSTGCYVGVMAPGALTATAAALRAPCGRIHFAGTESAIEHIGYLEGAIEAGDRAAREVIALEAAASARVAR